ncbi:hypothetical protein, partial [Microbacterium sp. CH12i]|uniref:hypothetical protein n=1 Tax=Microbacterium sp. CH12i TaxID=1479651 RepID=UPI00055FB42E
MTAKHPCRRLIRRATRFITDLTALTRALRKLGQEALVATAIIITLVTVIHTSSGGEPAPQAPNLTT